MTIKERAPGQYNRPHHSEYIAHELKSDKSPIVTTVDIVQKGRGGLVRRNHVLRGDQRQLEKLELSIPAATGEQKSLLEADCEDILKRPAPKIEEYIKHDETVYIDVMGNMMQLLGGSLKNGFIRTPELVDPETDSKIEFGRVPDSTIPWVNVTNGDRRESLSYDDFGGHFTVHTDGVPHDLSRTYHSYFTNSERKKPADRTIDKDKESFSAPINREEMQEFLARAYKLYKTQQANTKSQ